MSKHIIFGAPGTGKTTTLIKILDDLFNKGYNPEDICFCTYTKAASEEAKDRVINRFNIPKDKLINFGTIHSICYKRYFISNKVISPKEFNKFFLKVNLDYDIVENDEDLITNEVNSEKPGNIIQNFYDKLRIYFCKNIYDYNSNEELKSAFNSLPKQEGYDKLFANVFNLFEVLIKYEEYKKENELIDFVDMLLYAFKKRLIINCPILIVDEFQDLSPLQYELYKLWCENKKEIYLAGDDDQTIYSFICASPKFLLMEKDKLDIANGDEEIILSKTYRMNKNIHNYCKNYIGNNIDKKNRVMKDVESLKEGGEVVEEYLNGDLLKSLEFIREDKFTFILFRTNYYKRIFISEVLVPNGIIYYEIRGKSIWNHRTISLFNGCIKLIQNQSLDYDEVKYIIENIDSRIKLLKRGLKTNFKNIDKKDNYSKEDLIKLGFDLKLFNYNDYISLFNIFKITDQLAKLFQATPKNIITLPIKLKIGTIHSSKGKEADDVIIFKDISKRIAQEVTKDKNSWEEEMRVYYVGQSRSKERLVILRGGFQFSEWSLIP